MSNRDHEQLYRRLIDEVFNQGRLDVADELISHDSVEHQRGGLGDGPEGVKRTAKMLRAAFSDFSLTIGDIVVDGDKVWARQRGGGTNDGSFLAFPPTGKTVSIEVFDVVRIDNGLIVEHWGRPDQMGTLVGLGHVTLPARPTHPAV